MRKLLTQLHYLLKNKTNIEMVRLLFRDTLTGSAMLAMVVYMLRHFLPVTTFSAYPVVATLLFCLFFILIWMSGAIFSVLTEMRQNNSEDNHYWCLYSTCIFSATIFFNLIWFLFDKLSVR